MNQPFLQQAKAKAARYCAQRERAPSQVLEKLLSWELPQADAEEILAQLTRENFLDELRFCKSFCHDKFEFNQWGRNRIRLELGKYNLRQRVVEEGLNYIDPDRYLEVLNKLAATKWKLLSTEKDPWKRKNKTAAYLLRKGFEADLVWDAVGRCAASS